MGMYYYGVKRIGNVRIAVRLGGSHYDGEAYKESIDGFKNLMLDIEREGMIPFDCEAIKEKKMDDIMMNDIYNLLRSTELCCNLVSLFDSTLTPFAVYRIFGEFDEYYESGELSTAYPDILRLGD